MPFSRFPFFLLLGISFFETAAFVIRWTRTGGNNWLTGTIGVTNAEYKKILYFYGLCKK
jgi:hypothetical protein